MNALHRALLPAFFQDAGLQLEAMERALDLLARDPADRTARATVQRAAHTLKGNSGVMGFVTLVAVSGAVEDAMRPVADAATRLPEGALSILRRAAATLRALVACVDIEDLPAPDATLIPELAALASRARPLSKECRS